MNARINVEASAQVLELSQQRRSVLQLRNGDACLLTKIRQVEMRMTTARIIPPSFRTGPRSAFEIKVRIIVTETVGTRARRIFRMTFFGDV